MGVLNKDIWHLEVRNIRLRDAVQPRRWGMLVTVFKDDAPSNNTTWVLVQGLSSQNRNDNGNWQTIKDWMLSLGVGMGPVPKTAYFDGDDTETEFTIDEPGVIQINGVFVGGQRYREGVDYTKDNQTKKVTFTAPVPSGIGIDVEYFSYNNNPTADSTEITADSTEITADATL